MRGLVVVGIACGACASAPPPRPASPPRPPAEARIDIDASACATVDEARARIAQVIAARGATHRELVVTVRAEDASDAGRLRLVIERGTGDAREIGLDRAYTLDARDCESAPSLLALAVDRFLSAFPEWAGPPPPPPPPPPPASRWLDVTIVSAVSSMWTPLGVDGQAGAIVDLGAHQHRFGGSLLVRAGVPQAAGNGEFQQTALLAGAAYRLRSGPWRLRAEVRAGALLVTGMGFTENASDWLPWWEGAVFGGRTFGRATLGLEIAASGLRHVATTRDGLVREDIPLLRLGLAAEFGVVSRTP